MLSCENIQYNRIYYKLSCVFVNILRENSAETGIFAALYSFLQKYFTNKGEF